MHNTSGPTHRPRRFLRLLLLVWGLLPWLATPGWPQPMDLFFSEYVEGSAFNKVLEIYNGTDAAVDLAAGGYAVEIYFNGNAAPGKIIALTGAIAAGDVYVVAHANADPALLAQADQTSSGSWFNGNDTVVLRHSRTILDVIGQVGMDPGQAWGAGTTATRAATLRRRAVVCIGDADTADPFDPETAWEGFPQDTVDGLGHHTASCGGAGPAVGACHDPATRIHAIQRTGPTSPEVGTTHIIEGVVVGDFQDTSTELRGFFLQEEDAEADADPRTSEGIFVFDQGFGDEIHLGDVVRVHGEVTEFNNLTQLTHISHVVVCESGQRVTPATVTLPVVRRVEWEQYTCCLLWGR